MVNMNEEHGTRRVRGGVAPKHAWEMVKIKPKPRTHRECHLVGNRVHPDVDPTDSITGSVCGVDVDGKPATDIAKRASVREYTRDEDEVVVIGKG